MVLENIDKDNNQEISIQELSDAVKDGGFLDKPENIQKVAEHIQENTDELTNTLKENLGNQINDLLKKESYTKQELKIIYLWDKLISQENNETKTTLIKKLDGIVQNISSTVNKKIGKNEYGNINYYSDEQVMAIQLHANIKYGEQIKLDGQRITNNQESGILFDLGAQTHDQQLTNLYIYKQELATRGQVIEIRKNEKNLLNIPNIDNLLQTLGNTEIQKKVFSEFLNFFLEIRRGGFFFENKIGTKTLEDLLNDMINAEKYKDTPIGKFFGEDGEENKIKEELKKKGYTMMGEYFRAEVAAYKNNIQQLHNKNKEYNSYLVRIHNANTLLDEIKKLEEQISILTDPIEKIKQQRALLSKKLQQNEITLETYNTEIQKLEKKENEEWGNMFNEKNHRKDKVLRYQIIEKKIAIHNIHPDQNTLTLICLELKEHFNDDQIQRFLNQQNIKSSLDYKTYQELIKKNKQAQQELHKRDDINDILGQYNSSSTIKIERPTFNEFKENCFTEYRQLLSDTRGNIEFKDYNVPVYINKITIPGITKPIYAKVDMFNQSIPTEKEGKKIIVTNIKENKNNRELSNVKNLNDIKFAYASQDKAGNLIIEDIQGKHIRSISPQEQENAQGALHKASLDIYDYDMQNTLRSFEDMNTIMEPLNKGLEKYQSGSVFAPIFSSKEKPAGITQTEVNKTIQQLKKFGEKVTYAESQVPKRKEQRKKLKEIQKQSGGLQNDFEKGIDNMILTFDSMISFFEVKDNDTSQAREFKNQVARIDSNDTSREAFKDFLQNNAIKMLMAIGAAVLAIVLVVPTGGASVGIWATIVGSGWVGAVVGTLGGMVGLRAGTILNEYLLNTFDSRYSDGSLRFNDPTDIERVRNKEITSEEFFANLAEEFARGTITTMTFIKAGQLVGNAMAKSSNQMVRNTQDIIKRFMGNGNPQANHHAVNGFGKEFTKEFGQEVRQESREGFGEAVGNAAGGNLGGNLLGGLFSLMACLSGPSYAQISTKCNIAGGETKFNTTTGISTTSFTYDATTTDLQLLQNYWADQKIDVKIVDGKLIATQKLAEPMVRNGKEIHTQVYEYIPSHASTNTNNLVASLSREYDLTIKHEAKDPSGEKIDEVILGPNMDSKRTTLLQTALLMGKVGTITHHTDGSFTLHTTKGNIYFKQNNNTETKVYTMEQLQNIQSEAQQNAEKKIEELQQKLETETDPNKIKDIKEDIEKIEGSLARLKNIINGEGTLDDYTHGIRNLCKTLGLTNIETQQLPLTYRVIENHLKKQNPDKDITTQDIHDFVRKQLPIDQTIADVFGENFGKPEIFDTKTDIIKQINDIIERFPSQNSELLSNQDKNTMKQYAEQQAEAYKQMGLNPQQVFDMIQNDIRKLVFQNIADKGLLSGSDHGILHIVQGDIFTARNMLDQIQGIKPEIKNKIKAMLGWMAVNHDMGYNMEFFKLLIEYDPATGDYNKQKFFEATKDHPILSRIFVDGEVDMYNIFGNDFEAMKEAMLNHSDVTGADFSKLIDGVNKGDPKSIQQLLQKLISLADCAGVTHIDKLHGLFQDPNMILLLGKFEFIKQHFPPNTDIGKKLFKDIKNEMIAYIDTRQISGEIDIHTANYYKNAIEKGIDTSQHTGENPNNFGLKFNFSSFIYSPDGFTLENNGTGATIQMKIDAELFGSIAQLYGAKVASNNFEKLIGDYGKIESITIDNQLVPTLNKEGKIDPTVLQQLLENGVDKIIIITKAPDGSLITIQCTVEKKTVHPELKQNIDNMQLLHTNIGKSIQGLINNLENGQNKGNAELIKNIYTQDFKLGNDIKNIIYNKKLSPEQKIKKLEEYRKSEISKTYNKEVLGQISENFVNHIEKSINEGQSRENILKIFNKENIEIIINGGYIIEKTGKGEYIIKKGNKIVKLPRIELENNYNNYFKIGKDTKIVSLDKISVSHESEIGKQFLAEVLMYNASTGNVQVRKPLKAIEWIDNKGNSRYTILDGNTTTGIAQEHGLENLALDITQTVKEGDVDQYIKCFEEIKKTLKEKNLKIDKIGIVELQQIIEEFNLTHTYNLPVYTIIEQTNNIILYVDKNGKLQAENSLENINLNKGLFKELHEYFHNNQDLKGFIQSLGEKGYDIEYIEKILKSNKGNKVIKIGDKQIGYDILQVYNNKLKQITNEYELLRKKSEQIDRKILDDFMDEIAYDRRVSVAEKGKGTDLSGKGRDVDGNHNKVPIKGIKRTLEKFLGKQKNGGDILTISDLARGTLEYETPQQQLQGFEIILEKLGIEYVPGKTIYEVPNHPNIAQIEIDFRMGELQGVQQELLGYRDIQLKIGLKNGRSVELQINNTAMLQAKEQYIPIPFNYDIKEIFSESELTKIQDLLKDKETFYKIEGNQTYICGHKIYEVWRSLGESTQIEKGIKQKLENLSIKLYNEIRKNAWSHGNI